jgi:hypothetical protein
MKASASVSLQSTFATLFSLFGLCAALPQTASAQEIELSGKSFELTFTEHQSRFGDAPPLAADVPGISFGNWGAKSQENRMALTFRPGHQVDYEAERNYGAIYQRNPKPEDKGRVHTQRDASGTVGEWFHVPSPYTDTVQMRVVTSANGSPIVAELHGPNFMQVFEIVTDGVNCQAAITYRLEAGETRFKLFSLRTSKPQELAALSADHIRCSLGTADIF